MKRLIKTAKASLISCGAAASIAGCASIFPSEVETFKLKCTESCETKELEAYTECVEYVTRDHGSLKPGNWMSPRTRSKIENKEMRACLQYKGYIMEICGNIPLDSWTGERLREPDPGCIESPIWYFP